LSGDLRLKEDRKRQGDRPEFGFGKHISECMQRLCAGKRAKGYEITIVKDDDGRVNGIMIDPATSFRLSGADPREMGYALGW